MNIPRRSYPTDLSEAEWDILKPFVPTIKAGGRPARYSRREILNAILYVKRSGCAWRLPPHDFPPWETVYGYFNRWCKAGVWEQLRQALYEQLRVELKREPQASAAIADSQSVKTTEKGGVKGFDFYKKVKGRKRHILVDTEGLLMVVQVTAANVADHHQAFKLLQAGRAQSARLKKVWVDEGYQSKELEQQAQTELEITVEIVAKPNTGKGFQIVPRRWVVERTFAWLGRYRRFSKDYEYHTTTSEGFIQLAMAHLMLKRLVSMREAKRAF